MLIEMGPGPLGLCPVRGVVEVEKDSTIWLANTGTQPIRIEQNKVVAMAKCVTAVPGASPGDGQNDRDEVNGLVERAAPHLTDWECQQLRAAMAARKHLFATGKGDLGRTHIVQHQIHRATNPDFPAAQVSFQVFSCQDVGWTCQSVTVLFLAAEAFGRSGDCSVVNDLGSDRRVV